MIRIAGAVPRAVSIVALALVVVACQALPGLSGPALDGTGWRAVEVVGQAPVVGSEPTVYFEASRIGGSTGCNSFGGDVETDGASITIGEVAMTLMGCAAPIGDVEGRFIKALGAVERPALRADGRLVLSGPAGDLVFRPDPAVRP